MALIQRQERTRLQLYYSYPAAGTPMTFSWVPGPDVRAQTVGYAAPGHKSTIVHLSSRARSVTVPLTAGSTWALSLTVRYGTGVTLSERFTVSGIPAAVVQPPPPAPYQVLQATTSCVTDFAAPYGDGASQVTVRFHLSKGAGESLGEENNGLWAFVGSDSGSGVLSQGFTYTFTVPAGGFPAVVPPAAYQVYNGSQQPINRTVNLGLPPVTQADCPLAVPPPLPPANQLLAAPVTTCSGDVLTVTFFLSRAANESLTGDSVNTPGLAFFGSGGGAPAGWNDSNSEKGEYQVHPAAFPASIPVMSYVSDAAYPVVGVDGSVSTVHRLDARSIDLGLPAVPQCQ